MLKMTSAGCIIVVRERGSRRLKATITGGGVDGALRLRQDEDHTWSVYSEASGDYIALNAAEVLDDLLDSECDFRANELIDWASRPNSRPALNNDLERRASQSRVAELEREQRRRRKLGTTRKLGGGA